MMSLELRINGMLIGFAYIVNKMNVEGDVDLYSVEYHRIGKEDQNVSRFSVAHKPSEGAEKLAFLVYEKLNKELKGR